MEHVKAKLIAEKIEIINFDSIILIYSSLANRAILLLCYALYK